jgi:hypothetical protein
MYENTSREHGAIGKIKIISKYELCSEINVYNLNADTFLKFILTLKAMILWHLLL